MGQAGYITPANAYSPAVYDARARALGRTEILNNNGPASAGGNPALMAYITRPAIQLSGRMMYGFIDHDSEYYSNYDASAPLHLKFTNIAAVYPVSWNSSFLPPLNFTAGIAYNTYFDYGMNYNTEYTDIYEQYTTKSVSETHGGVHTISPAIAFNVGEKIHFGLAFHKTLFSVTDYKIDYDYEGLPEGYIGYDYREYEQDISAHFVAFGQVVDLTPRLQIGWIYRSEFRMKFIDGDSYTRYSNGAENEYEIIDSDIYIPAYTGIGVNYRLKPELLLSMEYQTRPFGGINYFNELYNLDSFWDKQYSGSCWRAGAELDKVIKWRMGLFADKIFAYDAEDNLPQWQYGAAIGGGLKYLGAEIDVFGEVSTWQADYNYDYYDDVDNIYKETFFLGGASLKYQF